MFEQPYLIFTLSALLLIAITILEAIAFFTTGASMESMVSTDSADVDLSAGGFGKEVEMDLFNVSKGHYDISIEGANLFNIGKVPFMIVLASLAMWFSSTGFSLHAIAENIGYSLSNYFSVPISFAIASVGTFFTTKVISKLVKSEETNSVRIKDLLGDVATVVLGSGDSKRAVQIRVLDKFGKEHFLMARVAVDDVAINAGDEVIILREEKDSCCKVIPKISSEKLDELLQLQSLTKSEKQGFRTV